MFEAPHTSHATALESEGKVLRLVSLSWVKNRPRLDEVLEILEEEDVKPLYIKKESLLITAIPSSQTLVRPLEIKLKKESDIASVFRFQIEPLLPFPVEAGVADRITLGQTADGTQLTILAVRKDHVQEHLDFWSALQVEPESVTSEAAALVCFGNFFFGKEGPYFIVHIGESEATCLLVKNRKLIASQSSSKEERDLVRTLAALEKKLKGEAIPEILLTGTTIPELKLGKTICTPILQQDFDLSVEKLQQFAVPLGAALSALPGNPDRINFRQQELAYPHPWKRFKKPLALYFSLCAALSIAFYLFGQVYIGYEEDVLRKEYVELLASMRKPYLHYESEYLAKNPSEKRSEEEEAIPAKALTQQEVLRRLNALQKEIRSTPDMYPMLPNVPRVSDVLGWLGNHPQVVHNGNTLIHLESFTYAMVKRPDLNKRQEKYQVRVDIEFSSATPRLAREFHDALITPNEIVDPKGEVKWSSNRGKYRTSFFLKDKTVYPR